MSVPTPHIASEKGQIAKTVLMPGDPLRAKFIADTFLTDPVLINNVRGVQGHTGTWKGVPVTVMASGMGIPAIGIYSWELFNFYDVDNIIRIAGALQDDIKVMDIVAAQGACTNSNYINQFNCPGTFAPIADYTLLSKAVEAAAAWFDRTKITGKKVETVSVPEGLEEDRKIKKDRILVNDPDAAPIWPRYSELSDNRPFFATREGMKVYDLREVPAERRVGYSWYGTWGGKVLKKYPEWLRRLTEKK